VHAHAPRDHSLCATYICRKRVDVLSHQRKDPPGCASAALTHSQGDRLAVDASDDSVGQR